MYIEPFPSPMQIRVDTYHASRTLVDIHLKVPLMDFTKNKEEFLDCLGTLLEPWVIRVEKLRLVEDR